jgi:hypothetical protein
VLAWTVVATPLGAAASQIYAVTDIGTLGSNTIAAAINNAGDVVGWSLTLATPDRPPADHAFL